MEIWKNVKGYEGLYAISNYGRVKNVATGKYRSLVNNGKGYLKVELHKDKVGKKYYVHRMVATAFLPNPDNKTEVNHIDSNPSNNHVSNLEWVSSSENTKHAIYKGALKAWGNEAKPIEAVNIDNGAVIRFATISEAERALGTRHITDVLKGKRTHAKGWVFRYAKEGDSDSYSYLTKAKRETKALSYG